MTFFVTTFDLKIPAYNFFRRKLVQLFQKLQRVFVE